MKMTGLDLTGSYERKPDTEKVKFIPIPVPIPLSRSLILFDNILKAVLAQINQRNSQPF